MNKGDRVLIRLDAFTRSVRYVSPEMRNWEGIEGIITDCIATSSGDILYEVDNEFYWEECQLELLEANQGSYYDELINELTLIYLQKNRDYGNSVQVTYEVFGATSTLTRISDKINRLKSLRTKEAEVQESIEDTVKDLINYWGIHKSMESTSKLKDFVQAITQLVTSPRQTLRELQKQLSTKILDDDTHSYIAQLIESIRVND